MLSGFKKALLQNPWEWFGGKSFSGMIRIQARKSEIQAESRSYRPKVGDTAQNPNTESPRKGPRMGFRCFCRKPPLKPSWIHLKFMCFFRSWDTLATPKLGGPQPHKTWGWTQVWGGVPKLKPQWCPALLALDDPRTSNFTLPAEFAWGFGIEKRQWFLVSFLWSPFPRKQSTKSPGKFRGKSRAFFGAKFGSKFAFLVGQLCLSTTFVCEVNSACKMFVGRTRSVWTLLTASGLACFALGNEREP